MKKLIFILAILSSINFIGQAQISFSCNYRQYCTWNSLTKEYENCEGYEENSLFVMSESETMFTHTIESMKSTYYVQSRKYDKQLEVWSYDVVSDVGNKYYYVFDPKNKQFRALFTSNGIIQMVVFDIKNIF